MSSLGEAKDVNLSIEEEVNARRGYSAALNNPKVSRKSKDNALDLLNDELDGDTPRHYRDEVPDQSTDSSGLVGVEKAAPEYHDNSESEDD
ncbi:hypothetical protein DTO013E5_2290 [Penicillium roqueforti]|uniref:uncharacterized protein n=1 Tax=Penicillium roqueforti TaxID=5082 RepID=UPI00190DFE1F|nr:uncharacterized protein LCP9604111_9316 [Penicillium roqueforti]KAF9238872.1 hypothetical protein LCP9604111_9316 [Penicillium roqueforti]KAI1838160.1 hypothetical protein CBS147337_1383 [Penicillium roqueforti]KAI2678867.1 hypothetical protein CBS147355_4752 [Penicillium roqueforti]KAI2692560.1 hypothetical protein LCP963914a_654 [Penicillium roqueforti]KAI2705501.1 hypothetical protein CBS147372_1804 [Penicillium roqueforti]